MVYCKNRTLVSKKVNGSRIVERYFKNQLARWFKWSKEENRSLYNRMNSVNLCVASWIAYAILYFSQRVILRNAIGCQPDIFYTALHKQSLRRFVRELLSIHRINVFKCKIFNLWGKYILKFHSLNGFSDENNVKIIGTKCVDRDYSLVLGKNYRQFVTICASLKKQNTKLFTSKKWCSMKWFVWFTHQWTQHIRSALKRSHMNEY